MSNERKCLECNVHFKIPTAPTRKDRKKYCSNVCRNKGSWKLGIEKRGDVQRGRGEGKTYTKFMGKHKHRVVMEKFLGRKLNKDEVVHHVDNNRKNNDIKNLKVMTRVEHSRYHTLLRHKKTKCQN